MISNKAALLKHFIRSTLGLLVDWLVYSIQSLQHYRTIARVWCDLESLCYVSTIR